MLSQLNLKKYQIVLFGLFTTLFIEVTNVPNDILIPVYGNVIGLLIVLFALWRNFLKAPLTIIIITIIYAFYGVLSPDYYSISLDAHKAYLYALISVVLGIEFKLRDYSADIKNMFFVYLILSFGSFYMGIGVDANLISERIQGFMSEPSALSMILCYLFWSYYKEKNYKRYFFVIIVSALTMSLTVYANFLVFYLLLMLAEKNLVSFTRLLIITIIGIGSLFGLSRFESDNWLVSKAADAATHIVTGGDDGRNTRSIDFDQYAIDQNQNKYSVIIGNGPGYGVYFYDALDQLSLTTNIQSIIYFDFGLFGLIVFFFISIYGLSVCKSSPYYYLFLSSFSYSLINTASGIVNVIYFYALLVLFLMNISSVRSNKLRKLAGSEHEMRQRRSL